ncbi:NRPS-like enzyme [Penicillium angulare]|uniref:NRPS-like enzyme n=1 Tax=Penicillium angulare TaxID=116970 RepID=A0A9W9G6L7_9EURO|nr:NRPS-like enzyme [Penicillium angulare]
MGSVLPEQVQATSIQDLPVSKLPCFNVNASKPDNNLKWAHTSTVHNVPLHSSIDSEALLRRYARFVGDIAGSDQVAFLADAPEIGHVLLQAVIPVPGPSGKTSEPQVQFVANATPQDEADFKIIITTSHVIGAAKEGPSVLSVVYTQPDMADITLTIRSDHAGSYATRHLAELAATYLTSATSEQIMAGAGLEPSRVNFEPYLDGSSPYSLPVANGVKKNHGYQRPRLLHGAFEEHARHHPDNIAFDYLCREPTATSTPSRQPGNHRRDLTYGEVNTLANFLASELGLLLQVLEDQWRPALGDQYAFPLFMSPSPDLFLTKLAVLKSGHAFSSLPADAPPERIRAIVEDLGSPVVLGSGPVPWQGIRGDQEEIDHLVKEIKWIDITNPDSWRKDLIIPDSVESSRVGVRVPSETDLCYLFYTSGSTGKPKGVLGSHRSAQVTVEATLAGPLSHLPAGPRLRWLNLSAPSFDPVIIDTFAPLFLGGVLCIAERDLLLTDIEGCARELGATASYAVASLALLMRPENMPALKTLIVGGEAVNGRVIEKFAAVEGSPDDDRRLVNAYGPTETTIFCTAESCTQPTRSSVIGGALDCAFLLVADADALSLGELREMPLGLEGELIVGGPQVALGYLNRPDATEGAFLSVDKFPQLGLPSGTMLYRTGDKTRVVWDANGRRSIDFIGRISSEQVKLNGRRVELSEIENVLTSAEGVATAAVVVIKPPEGGRAEIKAFLTTWTDADPQVVEENCRSQGHKLLPDWMCPGTYTVMEKLPWTLSGKIDRKTLLQIATGDASKTAPVAKAPSPTPAKPLQAKEETKSLPLDSASIVNRGLVSAIGERVADSPSSTSLLSIGLDSLRAIMLLQAIRGDGIDGLALHQVLTLKTIDDLVGLVDTKNPASQSSGQDAIVDAPLQPEALDDEMIDDVDVSAISPDDEEALYELGTATRLRHFSHHCMDQCLSYLGLEPADVERVLPPTSTQTRIIYLNTLPEHVDPTLTFHQPQVEHFLYDLPLDKLEPTRFRNAVYSVLKRHDAFRTLFSEVKHSIAPFAMCILNKNSKHATIPTVDVVCNYDSSENSLWKNTLVSAQRTAETSMTPNKPGVTVTWVRSPDNTHYVMVLTLFHGIYDGVSLAHLCEEFAAEYAQPGKLSGIASWTGDGSRLPLLSMRETIGLTYNSTDEMETMFYWMRNAAGSGLFTLGSSTPIADGSRALTLPGQTETYLRGCTLSSKLTMDQLADGSVSILGTSMLAVVQAAWISVLAQTREKGSGKDKLDVRFGSVLHGRQTQDLFRCLAPLLQTIPFRMDVNVDGKTKNLTNREICQSLTEQSAQSAPYTDIPCPSLDMYRTGERLMDTSVNLQAYRPAHSQDGGVPRELPGWSRDHNLLIPYKEVDIGMPIMIEVWPAHTIDGPDWSRPMTFKTTYHLGKEKFPYVNEEYMAGVMGAFDEALVRIMEKPDDEFYVA